MLTLLLLSLAAAPGGEKPKLIVMDLAPAGGIDPSLAAAMTEALTAEVSARGFFSVVSSQDVRTMLGQERQKQLLGCSEGASSCLTELAGALGAPFVLSGTLAKLGDTYQLTLQTLDSTRAQPVSRSVRLGKSIEALRDTIPFVSAEATATPLPEPPSRALPISLLVAGGVGVLGAGVLALDSFSRDQLLGEELRSGADRAGRLKTLAEYEQDRAFIGTERSIALGASIGGALLVGAGTFLLLRMPPVAGTRVSFAVTGRGVAFSGVW